MFQTDTAYTSQLESKLRALTLSPSAAHWVAKALHPVAGATVQMPDAVQVSTLVPEYKTNTVIGAPPGLGAGLNWDCCIILPPSDRVAAYISSGASGIDFRNTVGLQSQTIVHTGRSQTTSGLITGPIVTNATGVWGGLVSLEQAQSTEDPAVWRTVNRSGTVYATGSDLYNQGTVYAAQYARPVFPQPLGVAVNPGAGNFVAYNVDHVELPLNEVDMAVMTPNLYTAPARDGVYTVHRLTGPAQEFVPKRSSNAYEWPGGTQTVLNTTRPTRYASDTLTLIRFLQNFGQVVSPIIPENLEGSSGFDGRTSWGVIIVRGMHPQMSLTLKTVCGLEIVPGVTAPSRQFVKPPCKFEPTAIAAYYAIASEVSDCMAAKHNFLGTLLPILSQVASRVLPFLAPMAGDLLRGVAGRLTGSSESAPAPAQAAPRPRRSVSVSSRVSRASTARSRGSVKRVKIAKGKKKRSR
jgi:hypothetical protein